MTMVDISADIPIADFNQPQPGRTEIVGNNTSDGLVNPGRGVFSHWFSLDHLLCALGYGV